MISKIFDSIYRSIQEENIQWDHIINKLNEEILLSIERYNQMEKRFNNAKFLMLCIVYKKLIDKQKKDFKYSMNQWQNEKATQTIKDKKMIIHNESQLIDDIIIKLEQFHLNLNNDDNSKSINDKKIC